jgi:hypothetical protein
MSGKYKSEIFVFAESRNKSAKLTFEKNKAKKDEHIGN